MKKPFTHTWRIAEHGGEISGRDCIMRSLWCAIFMLLLPITLARAQPYRRVTELAPIRCSYGDIRKIVEYLEKHLPAGGSQRVTFGDDKQGLQRQFKTASEIAAERNLPGIIYEFDYRYEFDTYSRGSLSSPPISGVTIRMNDFKRTIQVEGGDFDSVNDLLISLENRFEPHEILLAGTTFRLIAGLFLYLLLMALFIFSLTLIAASLKGRSATLWTGLFWLGLVAALAALPWLLMTFVPFEKWFAGFQALNSNSTFWERYSAEFTFLGFLVTLISLMIPAARKLAKNVKVTFS